LQGAQVTTLRHQVIIVGGAGFIGSHFTDALLADSSTRRVTLYDNFSSGQEWHYAHHLDDSRLQVVRGEANDQDALCAAMEGHDLIIHLASNPDIAAAMTNPAVDFDDGTKITFNVVEAMRRTGTPRIAYASGSGVYGDLGEMDATEDHGPMIPVSTYGASKLAGEALISAYAYMFDAHGVVCRFGNVVGRRQTHGVGFDFVRRLRNDPTRLTVLGNGTQSKSYVLVTDVVRAVLMAVDASADQRFAAYNVATGDYVTVREIVALALEVLGLTTSTTEVVYGEEPRGWKGDVPIVRISNDKIRAMGWAPTTGSAGALRASMQAMLEDLEAGVV
jgi:UDP-glucose 4-epimerase